MGGWLRRRIGWVLWLEGIEGVSMYIVGRCIDTFHGFQVYQPWMPQERMHDGRCMISIEGVLEMIRRT